MSIKEREEELKEEFEIFDDWTDKYQHIIDLGKSLQPLAEEFKTEDRLIKGCQSRVWVRSYMDDNKIFFEGDSDAIITKGLVALIIRVLSGNDPKEIVNAPLDFLKEIGLHEHLSPTRSNGLVSMIKQMKLDALAYQAKK
jgi:cysteine desulfuration protein SufE